MPTCCEDPRKYRSGTAGRGPRTHTKWLPFVCSLEVLVTPAGPGPTREMLATVLRGALRRPHDWRRAPYCRLLIQRENHVDRCIDFDRFTVEQRRLVLPLLHGVHRCANQQRMARENFEGFDRATLGNDGVEANRAGDAGLACQRRIDRLNFVDEQRGLNAAALTDARCGRLRWWWRSAHAANHAADDAAHRTAGDAARDTTGHAGVHIGS